MHAGLKGLSRVAALLTGVVLFMTGPKIYDQYHEEIDKVQDMSQAAVLLVLLSLCGWGEVPQLCLRL